MYLYYGFVIGNSCSCDDFIWFWRLWGKFFWLDSLSAGMCTGGFVSRVVSRSISYSMRRIVFRAKLWIFSKFSAKLSVFSSSMQWREWHTGFCSISIRAFAIYLVILKVCQYVWSIFLIFASLSCHFWFRASVVYLRTWKADFCVASGPSFWNFRLRLFLYLMRSWRTGSFVDFGLEFCALRLEKISRWWISISLSMSAVVSSCCFIFNLFQFLVNVSQSVCVVGYWRFALFRVESGRGNQKMI